MEPRSHLKEPAPELRKPVKGQKRNYGSLQGCSTYPNILTTPTTPTQTTLTTPKTLTILTTSTLTTQLL